MQFAHDGLTLWYGTPDSPAPLDDVASRTGTWLSVGVKPANPTNMVRVRYRVDRGIARSIPGRELRTDYGRNVQYFAVNFPPFPTGDLVEYCPVLSCAGVEVPAPGKGERFPSKFFLPPRGGFGAGGPERPTTAVASCQRFAAELKFVAAVTVRIDPPQFVGETPSGVRIDFFARDGSVIGPGLRATVFPGSSDHMIVRPDGVGVIRVRALVCADDGARFEVDEHGSIDFGPDGYERARANKLPDRSPLIVCPRILTGHPKYSWLNRVQCVAAGATQLDESIVAYDIFAATPRERSSGVKNP